MISDKRKEFPSELRYDMISKDWVVIATGRARRPETFKKEKRQKFVESEKSCPFCKVSSDEKPTLAFFEGKKVKLKEGVPKNWTTIVLPNKYPAFARNEDPGEETKGLYKVMNALGFHEVLVTQDHQKQMAQFSTDEIKEVVEAYQERFLELINEKFVNYVLIFHNHGAEAGASISHPHSQIVAIPLIDTDLKKALLSAEKFYDAHQECVYCRMNEWEREQGKRIVFENKEFLVLCPFASKAAFEIIISPKKHSAYFERMDGNQRKYLAEAFQQALGRLYRGLEDPPYNFYLHTAPCDGKNYDFYHWHWTILPKTAVWAGFELGVGMEISTIEPERAADYLRKQ